MCIQPHNGKFLRATPEGGIEYADEKQSFTVVPCSSGGVAFRTALGKFLTVRSAEEEEGAEKDPYRARAFLNAEEIGETEVFVIVDKAGRGTA